MPINCACLKYSHIEENRKSIDRRIKVSKRLKEVLTVISGKSDGQNKLYRCDACNQYWQGSYAWNWGGREYLFKVPATVPVEWQVEPYVQPDQLIVYNGMMQEFKERIKLQETDSTCRISDCGKHAIRLSIYCLQHHIEQLQATGLLPKKPQGRYFPPYDGSSGLD